MDTEWDKNILPNSSLAANHRVCYNALRKVLYMCTVDALLAFHGKHIRGLDLYQIEGFVFHWMEENKDIIDEESNA